MAYPIRPFTEGYRPLPTAPAPIWQWDARQAALKAWAEAAHAGADCDACLAAYTAAWDEIERTVTT